MMQPLKEVARALVPSLFLRRLGNTEQVLTSWSFSSLSHQKISSDKSCVHSKSQREATSLFLNRKLCDEIQQIIFPSHHQSFHHSAVVLMTGKILSPTELSETLYELKAEETLESLSDFFEELQEIAPCSDDYDSGLGNGVLTVHFSGTDGTYIINKQTPNKQIWLSSPLTGPKRYDYCNGKWIYLRDGRGLHTLLEEEVSEILGVMVSLKQCKYYS